ncbi:hypothetical protein MMC13_002031 [Lambiella insularis]|nr:hypothetical protein [Lambiella insularis]
MVGITSRSEDDTLHLPRILCLHGGGTNARIFRAQCRAVEKALKPFFRLCYAQAPYRSKPGPDVVSVYQNYAPFRAWLDPEQDTEQISKEVETTLQDAMNEDDRRGATGEFIGLLGFSQGAKICGSLLLAQQLWKKERGWSTMPRWKFAVLLAGRGPLMSTKSKAAKSASWWHSAAPTINIHDPAPLKKELLKTPTIHVHGLRDPALDLHRRLLHEHFDHRHARVVQWDGEHRVPIKTKDVAVIVGEVLSMARDMGLSAEDSGWRGAAE